MDLVALPKQACGSSITLFYLAVEAGRQFRLPPFLFLRWGCTQLDPDQGAPVGCRSDLDCGAEQIGALV